MVTRLNENKQRSKSTILPSAILTGFHTASEPFWLYPDQNRQRYRCLYFRDKSHPWIRYLHLSLSSLSSLLRARPARLFSSQIATEGQDAIQREAPISKHPESSLIPNYKSLTNTERMRLSSGHKSKYHVNTHPRQRYYTT